MRGSSFCVMGLFNKSTFTHTHTLCTQPWVNVCLVSSGTTRALRYRTLLHLQQQPATRVVHLPV